MKTCRQISALILAREDRPLRLGERLSVRMHMAVCRRCPVFERQILQMRHLLGDWRRHLDRHVR